MIISRHAIPEITPFDRIERFDTYRNYLNDFFLNREKGIHFDAKAFNNHFCLYNIRHLIFQNSDDRRELDFHFNIYSDLFLVHIYSILTNEAKIWCNVNGEKFCFWKQETNYKLSASYWIKTLFFEIIRRNNKKISELLGIVWKMRKFGLNKTIHNYFFQYITAYFQEEQTNLEILFLLLKNKRDDFKRIILACPEIADSRENQVSPEMYFIMNMYPQIEILHSIFLNDEVLFNKKLREILLSKKNWIEENQLNSYSMYWVDFQLLGCCIIAYDKGFSIQVESEYIPKYLYKFYQNQN